MFKGIDCSCDYAEDGLECRHMREKLSRLKKKVRSHLCKDYELDDLVHDAKSQEASNINNAGFDAQFDYLIKALGVDWAEKL